MTTPAWGTPPEDTRPGNEQPREYTVCGLFLANGQRWTERIYAESARAAEDQAVEAVTDREPEASPQVTGVFYAQDDAVIQADLYAFYLDPDEPGPED